jgi:hypothetical protein
MALSLGSATPLALNSRTTLLARAADSSQLDGNWLVLIGVSSV